jgi:ATP-dependent 26S proteasome regulatory subunit
MSLQRGINFRALAEKMGHCSGAEVRGICTEAGEPMSSSLHSSTRPDDKLPDWLGLLC